MEEKAEHRDDLIEEPGRSYDDLIDILHSAHMDNARLHYFARGHNNREFSQMPLTPFIYEFFLFNSLYQNDWSASNNCSGLTSHSRERTEDWKQRQFVKFLRSGSRKRPELLYRAFAPICDIEDLDDTWTKVSADSRITDADGDKFFARVRAFRDLLKTYSRQGSLTISKSRPDLDGCIAYINKVRNNIFHGSKTLGDSADENQKRRIEVYELFLKGLTSLFFLVVGKSHAACDIVPCAVKLRLQSENGQQVEAYRGQILDWTSRGLMKEGDSRLIQCFVDLAPAPGPLTERKAAMFYPSAGEDMLTPLLLALPYCTHFYFYTRDARTTEPPMIQRALRSITSVQQESGRMKWNYDGERQTLNCIIGGVSRAIYWCHSDNLEFLKENVSLQFYFHRGDSWGEGGSGQRWDSDLLPGLLSKIPRNGSCLCLTDGVPGGFTAEYSSDFVKLDLPFVERKRAYYYGELRSRNL